MPRYYSFIKGNRMTRKNRTKNLRSKLTVLLAIVCAFSASLLCLTACSKSDNPVTDPTYTYTKPDNGLIANANFSYALDGKDLEDFPITAPTGWSKSTENSTASAVNSGVVDVSDKGWEKLLDTIYSDSDFVDYVMYTNKGAITNAIRDEKGDLTLVPTDDDIKEYIKNHKADYFANPGKYSDDCDDYMFMLNNYTTSSYIGYGTAQKVTSSSSVTVEAGKNYMLSVNVKTVNLYGTNADSDYANIRLTNSLGGTSQAEYRINGIKTDGQWKNYTIYIKGDAQYDATFTLVLGLGYGGTSTNDGALYTEGTAFFDDVKFEEVENLPSSFAAESALTFGSTDKIAVKATAGTEFLYDLSLENTNLNKIEKKTISFSNDDSDYFLTKSNATQGGNVVTSKTLDASSSGNHSLVGDKLTLTLNKASYTARLNSTEFKLDANKFAYITFDIANNLSKFGSTDISVDVFEKVDGKYLKTAAVATFSESSDKATQGAILLRNNFDSGVKEFYLEFVIGPSDVLAVNNANDFASGTVTLSNLKLFTGSTDSKEYETADFTKGSDNPEYKLFNFFSSNANATVALYKGYSSDFTEEYNTENYSIKVAPGSFGEIVSYPTAPQDYFGISSNHAYITAQTDNDKLATDVNDRVGSFTGNYAGLINTKYLNNYNITKLTDALNGAYTDDIQPLVIYNNDQGDHYGFISNSSTIAANAYARVSVTLRVVNYDTNKKASANVYIVNTAELNKTVMQHSVNGVTRDLMLTVNSDMMDSEGWATVDFYIGAGANPLEMRVEIWNGLRNGSNENKSFGYVFVRDITVTTSSAFTEPSSASQAFTSLSGNPLAEATKSALEDEGCELIPYTRKLTSTEERFNKEHPEMAVSYTENYVWAKNANMVYAIYNTIDPLNNDPYEQLPNEDTNEESGCNASRDPATFWMSFSSILLAVILVAVLILLILKNARRRIKARKGDVKSHYKVKSRIQISKDNKKTISERKAKETEEIQEETEQTPEVENAVIEEAENNEQSSENSNLDEYVYGDVQDFGDAVTNEDNAQEVSTNAEEDSDAKQ